jgi:hypothetical protein
MGTSIGSGDRITARMACEFCVSRRAGGLTRNSHTRHTPD